MILEKSMSANWLSNTWLVGDRPGGKAVVIDTGGPFEPILAKIAEHRLELTHVLCTHHHIDHVAHNREYQQRFGCPVCGSGRERELFAELGRDLDLEIDEHSELRAGELVIRPLFIPGHTRGQLGYLINGAHVFTGDTLFKGSVGGTRAPGHTTFEDLSESILGTLMALPPETAVHPGHMDSTTIGHEWEHNPFVRAFRGAEPQGTERILAFGRPATLLIEAPDYDGGTKAWVRFLDDQSLATVPGSRLQREAGLR